MWIGKHKDSTVVMTQEHSPENVRILFSTSIMIKLKRYGNCKQTNLNNIIR
nr:MAG TPA: hypothetical protein [Caudoviricetes sp.]